MNYNALIWGMLAGILRGVLIAWPIWLLLGIVFAVKLAFRLWERQRLAASGIDDIDRMDGRMFEKYLEVMFQRLGHSVERTQYVGDWGRLLLPAPACGGWGDF